MSENIPCIICKKQANIVYENMEGYMQGMNFTIYNCTTCNTSFASPHIVDEKLYDYIYSQPNITPGYNRYFHYAKEIKKQSDPLSYLSTKEGAYFAIKEILNESNKNSLRILEVGSGLGYLTYSIHQKGYNITGLDISYDAVANSQEKFGDYYICKDLFQYALENHTTFDLVILTDVIEHIPDPSTFCDALINLLKKGGKIVITTPNKSAFSINYNWETELPPIHLTWFSEESFKILANEKNLLISFFDFTDFNKNHWDITRFKFYNKFYNIKKRLPVLNELGKVISPVSLKENNGFIQKLKSAIKTLIKPILIRILTDKSKLDGSIVLCVILEKRL